MSSPNWKDVKELLDEILDLPKERRETYLAKRNVSAEMRAEIDSLIAFEDDAAGMMQLSAVEFSKEFIDDDMTLCGQSVGPYQVISELGYGGMGVVYLAQRIDGKFEQRVALKLLKRELNTASLRGRFENEQKILARLEHVNISRLLDAGTTSDRIPYLAMEYVDGLPIDEYCVRNSLDLEERLELFLNVCSAVDFAHRNLVIHRDLKPSNIIVTKDGTPKLLDFGISKIISDDVAAAATVTRLGVMTPGYASPEQLRGDSVSTATDVYSLGVILFELLSGRRPFEQSEGSLKDIYHAVLETEPPLPSAWIETENVGTQDLPYVQSMGATAPSLPPKTTARTGNVRPHSLRGDLDNIVLKAIQKEPGRRYSSAENLAEDIRRHLAGLPVTALPDTFLYRTAKFVRRNRLAVIGASLIALVVIGGIAATLWQARNARIERDRAAQRFEDVRGIANSFLTEFSPLIENLPGSTPARKLLVTRALQYLDKLSPEGSDDPAFQNELAVAYEKVADIQGNPFNPNIGDVKGARQSYEKAMAIRENIRAKTHSELNDQDASLFEKVGGTSSNGGEFAKAVSYMDLALQIRQAAVDRDPMNRDAKIALGRTIRSRGLIEFYEGNNKEAIKYYGRSRDIFEQVLAENPADDRVAHDHAYMFVALGEAYGWDTELALAAEHLQKGLDRLIPLADKYPNDLSIQRSLNLAFNKRAENYEDSEEPAKAVDLYSKGLAIAQKTAKIDPDNVQAKRDVAMGYKKMAQAMDSAGRSKESASTLINALGVFRELSEADPDNADALYDVANTRFSLGETYLSLKDHEIALKTFDAAKQEFDLVLARNPDDPYAKRMSTYNLDRIGKTYVALAEKGERMPRLLKAVEYFRLALAGFNRIKDDGKLGEYDLKELPKMEENLRSLEATVAKI